MLGKVYTVDTSMNTTEDRVYIKETRDLAFLKVVLNWWRCYYEIY